MKSIPTGYGRKRPGTSPFIIIAPHGAGDDAKTGIIADRLSRALKGFLVINNTYKKPTNDNITDPACVEDFNDLRWGHSYDKYLWKPKVKDMKLFYKDIKEFSIVAREKQTEGKAIVIYIHGMHSDKEAIDIGAGAKKMPFSNAILGSKKHKFLKNRGKLTLPIAYIKKLRTSLLQEFTLIDPELKVTIGKHHPGWSKQSAIQFHKHEGRDDYAIQLEISHLFRQDDEGINTIVNILKKTLTTLFITQHN